MTSISTSSLDLLPDRRAIVGIYVKGSETSSLVHCLGITSEAFDKLFVLIRFLKVLTTKIRLTEVVISSDFDFAKYYNSHDNLLTHSNPIRNGVIHPDCERYLT